MAITKATNRMINGAIANVVDFGADPSGASDSSTAIQNAINSSSAVYFPDGEYLVTSGLTITSKTTLTGNSRNSVTVNFKPTADAYLFTSTGGRFEINKMLFLGTDHYYDPDKTPSIKSGFLFSDASVDANRLWWDASTVRGFNHDKVVHVTKSIETYITRCFFSGPYINFGDSAGTTTTRTSNCFYFDEPWNTTTHFDDCFIQAFKFGILLSNSFMTSINKCSFEGNFIAIVATKFGATYPSFSNYVTRCYFEANKYSLGGAGFGTDFDDTGNPAKEGQLFFDEGYFQDAKVTGGTSLQDVPTFTYGNVLLNYTLSNRLLHAEFISQQKGWSHVAGQFDSYIDSGPTYGTANTLADTGLHLGFSKNINNATYDKQFRVQTKTGSGVGTHASFCILSNTEYDTSNPFNDSWDSATEHIRMRIQGGNAYLSGGGAWNTSGADYAEMFEWHDGNPENEDRSGMLVYLIGDKISIESNGSSPVGVITNTASVIGNNFSEEWSGKFVRDEFGRIKQNEQNELILNSDFDPAMEYIPRHERKEWGIVGLFGRLRIRTDQAIPDSWIKIKSITENVDEYLIK